MAKPAMNAISRGHEKDSYSTVLPFLDLYGIATDKWTPMSDSACNPRSHTSGALINGRMCVAGGHNGAEIN
jgi:hypothetical protein